MANGPGDVEGRTSGFVLAFLSVGKVIVIIIVLQFAIAPYEWAIEIVRKKSAKLDVLGRQRILDGRKFWVKCYTWMRRFRSGEVSFSFYICTIAEWKNQRNEKSNFINSCSFLFFRGAGDSTRYSRHQNAPPGDGIRSLGEFFDGGKSEQADPDNFPGERWRLLPFGWMNTKW